MQPTTNHCTGLQPQDRELLTDEVTLESPKGQIVLQVCRRCWLISDDGETWCAPSDFIPGWHPFTQDVVLGGKHGALICLSSGLVSIDCGDTWVKPAELLPRDFPTVAEVLPPVPPRHVQLDRTRHFRVRRHRIGLTARYVGL